MQTPVLLSPPEAPLTACDQSCETWQHPPEGGGGPCRAKAGPWHSMKAVWAVSPQPSATQGSQLPGCRPVSSCHPPGPLLHILFTLETGNFATQSPCKHSAPVCPSSSSPEAPYVSVNGRLWAVVLRFHHSPPLPQTAGGVGSRQ